MSGFLPRRSLLSGGAAMAATAVLTAPAVNHRLRQDRSSDDGLSATVTVRWNAGQQSWAQRPPRAEFGVLFLSTNDPAATAPTDVHVQSGDVWRRHPDADEHV